MKANNEIHQLNLSHTFYYDHEINANKAKKLVVYHYPLSKGYKWKVWKNHLDQFLSNKYYPYLMRSHEGQFGLFIAIDSIDDQPPKIQNKDGVLIHPKPVHYHTPMNPIWIRLIMRKIVAFGTHCKGSHSLGRPLLKIDVWQGKQSAGINAISLDCRTQQYAKKDETEVVLFHENVPLRPLLADEDPYSVKSSLWVYDRKNILVRWIPAKGEKIPTTVYREIKKTKNTRKQRAFIDLSSLDAFNKSWPVILQPIQDELILQTAKYGFTLYPRTLNLQQLPHNTKYKSALNKKKYPNKKRAVIPSLPLNHTIQVLDLRVSTTLDTLQIIRIVQNLLDEKDLGATLKQLPPCKPEDITSLLFDSDQRILVLLDQCRYVIEDRYPLTKILRTQVACQHLNINPYDLDDGLEIDDYMIESKIDNEETIRLPKSKYYTYDATNFTKKNIKDNLQRNAEIVVKEVHIKHLLLSPQAKISTSLPKQTNLLTEDLVVITEGYLFTVRNDRPVLLPFNPSKLDEVKVCDAILKDHQTSVKSLFSLMRKKWPYNYKPEDVMKKFSSSNNKLTSFARRLTLVIHGKKTTNILLQDPRYETPHILPSDLDKASILLSSPILNKPINSWKLPDHQTLIKHTQLLEQEGILTQTQNKTLNKNLCDCAEYWEQARQQLLTDEKLNPNYKQIKKQFNENRRGSTKNTHLISSWEKLLSKIFNLSLNDPRKWLRGIPGIQKLWHDPKQGYYIVGQLTPPKLKIIRQPSIRHWYALQGNLDTTFLTSLIDVDWIRVNQLAGNPCVAMLARRWHECQITK